MAAGLSFFGATFSPPGGSISQSGQVLTFRVGDLAPMSSVTVVMTTTAPTTAGSPVNNAVVTATENDNNQGNNSAMVTTQVQLGVDLVVATTVAPPTDATVGSNLGFLIAVTNTAPRNATNVILMTSVPAGTTFVAVTSSTGSVTQNGDQIAVSIGTIAPTATVLVTLVVTPNIAGPVNQSATASSTELDIFPPNNTRETRVIVEPAITSQPTNNGPQILQTVRVRGAAHTARFRLTFNESLDATSAEDLRNYRLFIPGPDGRFGTGDDVRVGIRAAKYDPIARIVSLTTTRRLSAHATVEVRVDGVEPQALRDAGGVLLDGNGDGTPGGTYVARIRGFGAATVLRRNASRGRRG
jgi:uncharacterized repeat protein (TIGR01451 family)